MILRRLETPPPKRQARPRPIWDLLFEHQSRMNGATQCWLITQPLHAALSGDIAARLDPAVFGAMDESMVRAIALHDAGWSALDSDLVRASRDPKRDPKDAAVSFLGIAPKMATTAWTGSVETALKASPVGGFLVSEHFRSIAQFQVNENTGKAKVMAAFAQQEEVRQKKLRLKIPLSEAALERLVEGLRFCDLLSLYVCAGLIEDAVFSQQIHGVTAAIRPLSADTFALEPSPFRQDEVFAFSALRHPRTKTVSSATFTIKITG